MYSKNGTIVLIICYSNYSLQMPQGDKIMVNKSLPHEKKKSSNLSDNQEIEINKYEKQEIEENYSKVNL